MTVSRRVPQVSLSVWVAASRTIKRKEPLSAVRRLPQLFQTLNKRSTKLHLRVESAVYNVNRYEIFNRRRPWIEPGISSYIAGKDLSMRRNIRSWRLCFGGAPMPETQADAGYPRCFHAGNERVAWRAGHHPEISGIECAHLLGD